MVDPAGTITAFCEVARRYDPDTFVGRDWLVDAIARFRDSDRRSLILVDSPGTGKTGFIGALAQNWNCPRYFVRVDSIGGVTGISARAFLVAIGAQLYEKYGGAIFPRSEAATSVHAGVTRDSAVVIGRFVERLYTLPFLPVTDRDVTVWSKLASGQARVVGEQIGALHDIALSLDERTLLHAAVLEPLARLSRRAPAERVVILIDALDEAARHAGTSILDVIPRSSDAAFPDNVRIVMTSRRGRHVAEFRADDVWYLDDRDHAPAKRRDARRYIDLRLRAEPLARAAAAMRQRDLEAFHSEVLDHSDASFLYLFHFFNAVARDVAGGASLGSIAIPRGLDEIYRHFAVARIQRGTSLADWTSSYFPLLGALAVAREPVGRELLATFAKVELAHVDFVIAELLQFLEVIADPSENRYQLYHSSFADYLLDPARNRDWPLDRIELDARVAAVLRAAMDSPERPLAERYARRHLVAHLAAAGQLDELHALVATGDAAIAWAETQRAASGSYEAYLDDLEVAWGAASSRPDAVHRYIGYALIKSSVSTLNDNVTPKLLRMLVAHGLMSLPAALTQMRRFDEQATLTEMLAISSMEDVEALIDAVEKLDDERMRVRGLRLLPARWSTAWNDDDANRAILQIERISDVHERALLLCDFLPVLSDAVRRLVMPQLFAWAAASRVEVWSALGERASPAERDLAIAAASKLDDEWRRVSALAAISRACDERQRSAILACILETSPWARVEGLARLLAGVAPERRGRLPLRAWWAARRLREPYDRGRALAKIVPFLSGFWRNRAVAAARAAIARLADAEQRTYVMLSLAKQLSERERLAMVPEVVAAASGIADPVRRTRTLHELLRLAPSSHELGVAALDAVAAVSTTEYTLVDLVPELPETVLGLAFERSSKIRKPWVKERALSALAARLPEAMLPQLRDVVREITEPSELGSMLVALARQMPRAGHGWIVETAIGIADEAWRTITFEQLAPLVTESLEELVVAAQGIAETRWRAQALIAIAPRLPDDRRAVLVRAAVEAARSATDKRSRLTVLVAAVDHVPEVERRRVVLEAQELARSIGDRGQLKQHLVGVFGALPAPLQLELLPVVCEEIAEAIERWERSWLLRKLARGLSTAVLDQAPEPVIGRVVDLAAEDAAGVLHELSRRVTARSADALQAAARRLDDGYERAGILARVARHDDGSPQLIGEVTAWIAQQTGTRWTTAAVIVELPDDVLNRDDAALWRQALRIVAAEAAAPSFVVSPLESIARALASRAPEPLLGEVLAVVRAIPDRKVGARLLLALSNRLEPAAAVEVAREAVGLLPSVYQLVMGEELAQLAADAPPAAIERLVAAALQIDDEAERATALIALARQVAPVQRGLVIPKAFEAAATRSNDGWRAMSLHDLAPVLPDELLVPAFELVRALNGDGQKALGYSALGARSPDHPRLPPLARIRDAIRARAADNVRADVLTNLACYARGPERIPLIREALTEIGEGGWRDTRAARVLAAWAPSATDVQTSREVLADALHALPFVTRGRLLEQLVLLAPRIAEVGGEAAIRALFAACRDVLRWWP